MKTSIEIRIENKGHMLGTLGWFKEIMVGIVTGKQIGRAHV